MADEPSPEQLAAVSDAVAKLWSNYHGRGPIEAKSYSGGDGYIFTVMRGGLSPEELTLIHGGRSDLVRQMRVIFEDELRDEMARLVEEATGRAVADYASQFLREAEITVEIFALRPVGESG